MASTQPGLSQKPVLPLHVCEIVIDILASDNRDPGLISVKKCSLVSQSFLPLCRKRIFARIKAHNLRTRDAFMRLMKRTPAIGNYIRHLQLSFLDFEDLNDFLQTMQHLTRLESLAIQVSECDELIDWRALQWPVRNALLRLMYLPTLTALTLRGIDKFLITDLVHAANLRCLKVHSTTFFEDPTDAAPVTPIILPEKSVQLRELVFDGDTKASDIKQIANARRSDGLPVIDPTEITTVSVQCLNVDDMDALRTFAKQSEQLVKLDLTIPSNRAFAGFGDIITPHIRVLNITTLSSSPNRDHDAPLGSIPNELAKIAGENVRDLTIDVNIWDSSGDEWGKLDTALTSSRWPALKTVFLKIRLLTRRHGPEINRLAESFEQVTKAQFPRLSANVSVDFRIQLNWL